MNKEREEFSCGLAVNTGYGNVIEDNARERGFELTPEFWRFFSGIAGTVEARFGRLVAERVDGKFRGEGHSDDWYVGTFWVGRYSKGYDKVMEIFTSGESWYDCDIDVTQEEFDKLFEGLCGENDKELVEKIKQSIDLQFYFFGIEDDEKERWEDKQDDEIQCELLIKPLDENDTASWMHDDGLGSDDIDEMFEWYEENREIIAGNIAAIIMKMIGGEIDLTDGYFTKESVPPIVAESLYHYDVKVKRGTKIRGDIDGLDFAMQFSSENTYDNMGIFHEQCNEEQWDEMLKGTKGTKKGKRLFLKYCYPEFDFDIHEDFWNDWNKQKEKERVK